MFLCVSLHYIASLDMARTVQLLKLKKFKIKEVLKWENFKQQQTHRLISVSFHAFIRVSGTI